MEHLDLTALTNAEAKTLADKMISAKVKFVGAHMPSWDRAILGLYGDLRALVSESCLEVNVRAALGVPGEWS